MNGLAKISLLAALLAGSVAATARAQGGNAFRVGAGERATRLLAALPAASR